MYLDTRNEFHEAAAQEMALAGFNPLKAIGRALGSTGRALVGAVIPGGNIVSNVLDVAAKSPKGSGPAINQAITTALQPVQPAPATAPAPAPVPADRTRSPRGMQQRRGMMGQQTQPGVMEMMMANLAKATQPQTQFIPSGGGGSGPAISVQAPAAPAVSAMPPWLIPAGIGGLALVFLMSQQKGARR